MKTQRNIRRANSRKQLQTLTSLAENTFHLVQDKVFYKHEGMLVSPSKSDLLFVSNFMERSDYMKIFRQLQGEGNSFQQLENMFQFKRETMTKEKSLIKLYPSS